MRIWNAKSIKILTLICEWMKIFFGIRGQHRWYDNKQFGFRLQELRSKTDISDLLYDETQSELS